MDATHLVKQALLVLALASLGLGGLPATADGARAAPVAKSWHSWALKWERQAKLARARVDQTLTAYGHADVPRLRRHDLDTQSWGRLCKHAAHRWNARYGRLYQRMQHPGGSGAARWLPLARWCGWPASSLSMLVKVIGRESSGCPTEVNSSGHAGLLQLAREWYTGVWKLAGKRRHFNPCDPEKNLYWGHVMFRGGGWSAWAQTAY